jgi:hypothetical protein
VVIGYDRIFKCLAAVNDAGGYAACSVMQKRLTHLHVYLSHAPPDKREFRDAWRLAIGLKRASPLLPEYVW